MTDALQLDIFEHLPGYIGWKDAHSRYVGCNDNLAQVLRLKDKDKIIGALDIDLPGCTEDLFQFHQHNDQLVLTGQTVKFIHKSSAPYDGSFFYFTKKPIRNTAHQIIGSIFHCQEFFNHILIQKLYQADQKAHPANHSSTYYQIDHQNDPLKLSARELECLFCILRGKTAKQIGERLQLSKRTIEAYIENIKNKFGCTTKSEMIDLAIHYGYLHVIPTRFMQEDPLP